MENTRKAHSKSLANKRISRHAVNRCQQRGISSRTVDLILSYGTSRPCRDGGISIQLTRKLIKQLRHELPKGDVIQMEKQCGVYLILAPAGEKIVTAAWSQRRHWN